MSTLLLKNVPEDIKKKLKEQAELNHRSVNKEAIIRLEQSLVRPGIGPLPPPIKTRTRLTEAWLNKAKRWGRM